MILLPLFVSLAHLVFGLDQAEIVFAGDAMQHKAQIEAARRIDGSYDYSECFKQIEPLVKSADYAVVNLETPIGSRNFTGYPCFNAPSSFAKALKDAGFDMLLTANNHCLDRRDQGLHATIDSLDAAGIHHIGTYHNTAARDSIMPYIKNISGIKIGFLNYTYGTNGIEVQRDAIVDYIDKKRIAHDIAILRNKGAEIITIAIHWGDEYKLLPNRSQRDMADFLVSQGVDIIIGSHPHVVQPMEVRFNQALNKKTLIVYSLGNFISNMKTRDTRGGALVRVRIARDIDGVARFEQAYYKLIFTEPATDSHNFRLVDPHDYNGPRRQSCEAFIKAAQDIFGKHNIGVKPW